MTETIPNTEEERKSKRNFFIFFGVLAGVGGLLGYFHYEYFGLGKILRQKAVTIEGRVANERYIPQVGGCEHYPSAYFFSVDDPVRGRIGVEVIDQPEFVDNRLDIETKIRIKARKVGPLEYKVFAEDIEVLR